MSPRVGGWTEPRHTDPPPACGPGRAGTIADMARRPTHDAKGKILPLRQRQPYAYWITILVSISVVLSLVASAILTLL